MKKDTNRGIGFIVIGLLLIVAAFLLMAYNEWENTRAEESRDRVLESMAELITERREFIPPSTDPLSPNFVKPSEIVYPDYVLNPDMPMPAVLIDGYEYIGFLEIPAIGLQLPVMSEWDMTRLQVNPCRYVGSVYKDDMVVLAHNYEAFFRRLIELAPGNEVLFTDMAGNVFSYIVGEIITLPPSAVDTMINSDWDLTLFTCTRGGAARVTVRCERVYVPIAEPEAETEIEEEKSTE